MRIGNTVKQSVLCAGILLAVAPGFYVLSQERPTEPASIRSSAAYAEVLLRTAEVKAELESIAADYTETSPRVMDLRFELNALGHASDRIFRVRPSETGKLTLALGKLLVRKAALETDLARLQRSYTPEHNEVKRTRKKVEIFEAAINDVLK